MNITDLLQLLTESREVEDINEKIKGKVDPRVINTLAPLMKKGKYDNIAMAIFSALQKWGDGAKKAFLVKRPKLVYAALKEGGKDDSNFNPDRELNMFYYNDDEPMKYWADFRSTQKDYKERLKSKEKTVFGLPQARVKELPESFLFFPRNFKFDFDNFHFRVSDLNKQHEDIKALSQQMANKDTSGDPGAKVNHWCVAASDSRWFNNYKSRNEGSLFVIIVNKNPDGSPDWNDRYLWWISENGTTEFADKLDRHYSIQNKLPDSTVEFLENKVASRLGGAKGDKQKRELYKRAKTVYSKNSTNDGWRRKVNVDSPIFKNYIRILRFLRSKYNEANKNQPSALESAQKAFRYFVEKGGKIKDDCSCTFGNLVFSLHKVVGDDGKLYYYVVKVFRPGEKTPKVQCVAFSHELKAAARDIENLKDFSGHSYREIKDLDQVFKSKAHFLSNQAVPKKAKDALLNNNMAIQFYEALIKDEDAYKEDEIREFFIGPHFLVTVRNGQNTISVLRKPWSLEEKDTELIGDLEDPNIVDDVKNVYKRFEGKLEGKNAERS